MKTKHYFPTARIPATGVAPRRVPNQMAPERCVQYAKGVGGGTVILLGCDLEGTIRVRVELAADDLTVWWLRVIRHWLAWYYGVSEIKIVG
jgi:hypothetical protein